MLQSNHLGDIIWLTNSLDEEPPRKEVSIGNGEIGYPTWMLEAYVHNNTNYDSSQLPRLATWAALLPSAPMKLIRNLVPGADRK